MITPATSSQIGGVKLNGALAGGNADTPTIPAGYVTAAMLDTAYATAAALTAEIARAEGIETDITQAWQFGVQTEIGARNVAVTAEAGARAAAIAALQTTVNSLTNVVNSTVSTLTGNVSTLNAAIAVEAATRATADGTETARALAAEGANAAAITANTASIATKASKAANLGDLTNIPQARNNLGLNTAALQPASAFDPANAAAAVQANLNSEVTRAQAAEAAALQKTSNFSDVPNKPLARTNLGLDSAATQPISAFDAVGSAATEQTRALAAEATKANDAAVVHLAGTETVTGTKNFTGGLTHSGNAVVDTTDSRLTNTRSPSAGTVTDASIAAGGLTNAAISGTAGIGRTKLDTSSQASLGKADTAVQTVNGHAGPTPILASSDVGAVPLASYTAKGDILVASGAASPVVHPVGTNGFIFIADSSQARGVRWDSIASIFPYLVPTPVKTAAYNAAPLDLVRGDISGGSVAVNLPNAPADKTTISFKLVAINTNARNTFTVNTLGIDVFNVSAGSTAIVLRGRYSGFTAQYDAADKIWIVIGLDLGQQDPVHQVGGTNALGTTFGGAWGTTSNHPPLMFYQDQLGIVHIEGAAATGSLTSAPSTIFTLPSDYRPISGTWIFSAALQGVGTVEVQISLSGDVTVQPSLAALSIVNFGTNFRIA